MANLTSWGAGLLNSGLGWTATLTTGGVATLAAGSAILDGTDITNGTSLDIFADLSVSCTTASATYTAGMNLAFYMYILNQDGTTYGDNRLSTSAAAVVPVVNPLGTISLFPGATQTAIIGNIVGFPLPPGTFRFAMANNGITLTAATIKFRSYRTNLNN